MLFSSQKKKTKQWCVLEAEYNEAEEGGATKLRHGSEHGVVTANARTVLLVGGFRVAHLVELGLK